jgi:outer membrane protein assembly factor BamB
MSMVGPALRRVAHGIPLAAPPVSAGIPRIAGGATAADDSLRVVLRGVLFAIDPDAQLVRWSRDLRELALPPPPSSEEDEPPPPPVASLSTILGEDRTLVTASDTAIILGARGELLDRIAVPMADDSGPAPNTDREDRPILTTIDGHVHVWHPEGLRGVGTRHGYDIVPVAVFADGTFAISGYAGSGFCRVASGGRVIWRSDLSDPDMLPTVSRAQHAAVGSLNDRCSALFDPDGRRLATYPAAAAFAEYEADRGWIALGSDSLARLTAAGEVAWRHPLDTGGNPRWGCYQPIVDAAGAIYVATADGIATFDGAGARRAALPLGGQPMPLIPVRAGLMAAIVGDTLLLIE